MTIPEADFLGDHFIAEFHLCNPAILNDLELISSIMNRAAEVSGATIIKPFFHRFSPHGISGIIVVAESHFAIHTWPEHSYAAVDLFSCGKFGYTDALRSIRDSIECGEYSVYRIRRGNIPASRHSGAVMQHDTINL